MKKKQPICLVALLCLALISTSCKTVMSEIDFSYYEASLPVKYEVPQYDLPKEHVFEFEINFDLSELESYEENYTIDDFVVVYTDKALTKKAAYRFESNYDPNNETVRIIGDSQAMQQELFWSEFANAAYYSDEDIMDDYDEIERELESMRSEAVPHWQFFNTYYLVQKLDKNGNVLEKPIVTLFTIEEQELKTPHYNYSITQDGGLLLTWEPVEGAEKYMIVEITRDRVSNKPYVDAIATTTETRWDSNDYEAERAKNLDLQPANSTADDALYFMNDSFSHVLMSEDSRVFWAGLDDPGRYRVEGWEEYDEGVSERYEYGVVAVAGKTVSSIITTDGNRLYAQLPNEMANHIAEEMGYSKNFDYLGDGEQLPAQWPVTMCDGSTQLRGVILLPEKARFNELKYFDGETREYLGAYMHLEIPFRLDGTKFESRFSFKTYDDDYMQVLEKVVEHNAQLKPKVGTMIPGELVPDLESLADMDIERGMPNIAYEVTATNPLSEYIAAHLINHSEFIDLSEYVNARGDTSAEKFFSADDVKDALNEALYQNPLSLGISGYYFYDVENVLEISYHHTKEDAVLMQETIKEEAERVVAEVVRDGMTDLEKAQTLNNYLTSTAEYDYAALDVVENLLPLEELPEEYEYAWNAYGILIEKAGVCMSYAYAYKALCDEAGLECIVVTGIVTDSSTGHAWNKVRIDNNWRLIDVTWNDSYPPNRYFDLSDSDLANNRIEDADYVFDVYQRNYMTN